MQTETPEEKANRIGVPLIPKRKPSKKKYDENPTVAVCGECGHEAKAMEHYCCMRENCPLKYRAALSADSQVFTPTGWKMVEQLKTGDEIIAKYGKTIRVSIVKERHVFHVEEQNNPKS